MGFTLPVVPEIGDLKIGGLILGCGVGAGSARNGLMQHICVAFEMVTATGELVVAEKVEGEYGGYGHNCKTLICNKIKLQNFIRPK